MIEADSLEQVVGKPVLNIIAPEYCKAYTKMHKRVLAGESMRMEFEMIGSKGGRRWVETHATPMIYDGKVVHLAITRDITENKRIVNELVKLNRVYTLISQINNLILRSKNREKLFREICSIAITYGKFRMSWIGLLDDVNHEITPIAWDGLKMGMLQKEKKILSTMCPKEEDQRKKLYEKGKCLSAMI